MKTTKPLQLFAIALPVLCALSTACSSPSPGRRNRRLQPRRPRRQGADPGPAFDPRNRNGHCKRRTGRSGGSGDQTPRSLPPRVLVPGNDERLRARRRNRVAGRAAPGSVRAPKWWRRRSTRRRGPTSVISKALSWTGARRAARSNSSAARLLPGGEAFKLQVTLEDGAVRYDYVDVASRQIVRSDLTRMIRGHAVGLENTFSDFREVDGLVFPYLIETHVADRPEVLTITIDTIELNPDLDDSRSSGSPDRLQRRASVIRHPCQMDLARRVGPIPIPAPPGPDARIRRRPGERAHPPEAEFHRG